MDDVMELERLRMTIAYDGGQFRGFAPQPGMTTVGATLNEALSLVTQREVEVVCAGRTDAGVHAWGQVVSLDVPIGTDLHRLKGSLNKLCGPHIVVRDIAVAAPGFNARYSARWRRYRYTVLNRDVPDPFLSNTTWWVSRPLELRAMVLACDPFIGLHDFTSFCKRDKGRTITPQSLERRVMSAEWDDLGDGLLRFTIEANAFCHQMVRALVGTIVDVGLGKLNVGDVMALLRARNRSMTSTLAPPHGLCLWEVGYP